MIKPEHLEQYQPLINQFCRMFLGGKPPVPIEDLVNETNVKLLSCKPENVTGVNLTFLVSQAYDHLRADGMVAQSREEGVYRPVDNEMQQKSLSENMPTSSSCEDEVDFWDMVSAIPDQRSQCAIRYKIQGYTQDEIAELMRTSRTDVSILLKHAETFIKQQMEK